MSTEPYSEQQDGIGPYESLFDAKTNTIDVTDYYSNTVSGISASTNGVVFTVHNIQANALAFNSKSGVTYIGTENGVTGVNGTTGAPVSSLSVSIDVGAELFDPTNGFLYLGSAHEDRVVAINTSSNSVAFSVNVTSVTDGLMIDSRSNELWAGWQAGPGLGGYGRVFVLNASTGALVTTLDGENSMVLDSSANRVFMASGCTAGSGGRQSGQISVVNATSGAYVANITVNGTGADFLTYDSGNGLIYATGNQCEGASLENLTVVYPSNLTQGPSIPVGVSPFAVAYLPSAAEVAVVSGGADSVSFVNDSSNTLAATTPIGPVSGGSRTSVAFDAAEDRLYVDNFPTDNITAIDVADHRTVASIIVGVVPSNLIVDPANGLDYTYNYGNSELFAYNGSTHVLVAEIPIAAPPTSPSFNDQSYSAIVLDSAKDEIFVAGENLTVVSLSNNSVVSTIPLAHPVNNLVYDPAGGQVFAAGHGGLFTPYDIVYVINDTNDTVVSTISVSSNPVALSYDPISRTIWVADSASRNETLINAVTDLFVGNVTGLPPSPGPVAFDPRDDRADVLANYSVTSDSDTELAILNDSTDSVVKVLSLGTAPLGIAYDPQLDYTFVLNGGEGYWNMTVVNDTLSTSVASVAFGEAGFTITAGSLTYSSATRTLFAINQLGGTVALVTPGDGLVVQISASPSYLALGNSTMISAVASGGTPPLSYRYPYLPAGCASANTSNLVCAPNTTGRFAISVIVTDAQGQSASSTGGVYVYLGYPTRFVESGLPSGTLWSIGGPPLISSSPLIYIKLPDGAYSYNVTPIFGYLATPSSGNFTINGTGLQINVTFSPAPGFEGGEAALSELYTVYNARPDLQLAFPDAPSNLGSFLSLVDWAGGVVVGEWNDSSYATLAPFGYWYALMATYNGRADLQAAFPDAYGNFTEYALLVNWAGGVVTGQWTDPANATLSHYGQYYDLLMVYDGRADLQAAFPDAFTNLTNFTLLVNWAGGVVTGQWVDGANATLQPFGYYFALLKVYDGRSDLQSAYPSAFTNVTSYQSLLVWAKGVVTQLFVDSAYATLKPFAASYETLG